jgi:hypothetical protein
MILMKIVAVVRKDDVRGKPVFKLLKIFLYFPTNVREKTVPEFIDLYPVSPRSTQEFFRT